MKVRSKEYKRKEMMMSVKREGEEDKEQSEEENKRNGENMKTRHEGCF